MPIINEGASPPPIKSVIPKPTGAYGATGAAPYQWFDPSLYAPVTAPYQQVGPAPTMPSFMGNQLDQIVPNLISWRIQKNEWDAQNKNAQSYNKKLDAQVKAAQVPAQTYSGGRGAGSYGWKGVTGTTATKGRAPYGFQTAMWQSLQAANNAMKKAGLGGFSISSGWRSLQRQKEIYPTARKGYAAKPGTSIHGLGLAADLNLTTAQRKWLQQNGAKFGLYQPMSFEGWHWSLMPSLWKGQWD